MVSFPPQRRACIAGAFLLLLCAWPGSGGADEVYRWVDSQGRVHFSSTPPPDRAARKWEAKEGREINVVGDKAVAPPSKARPKRRPTSAKVPSSRKATVAGRSESAWRAAGQALQQKIDGLEAALEQVEDGPEFHEKVYRGGSYSHSVNKASRTRRLEHQLEAARDALDRFEERAREKGVPPGWLR